MEMSILTPTTTLSGPAALINDDVQAQSLPLRISQDIAQCRLLLWRKLRGLDHRQHMLRHFAISGRRVRGDHSEQESHPMHFLGLHSNQGLDTVFGMNSPLVRPKHCMSAWAINHTRSSLRKAAGNPFNGVGERRKESAEESNDSMPNLSWPQNLLHLSSSHCLAEKP